MSDYITGDEMIELLIAEGGDEGATYDLLDESHAALVARNRDELVRLTPRFGAVVHCYIDNERAFERAGLIRWVNRYYVLTPAGADLVRALRS